MHDDNSGGANPPRNVGRPLKVFFACTGVGVFRGGIESFFREACDGLRDLPQTQITLFKGAGANEPGEIRLRVLKRTRLPAKAMGKLLRRSPYVIEQLSSLSQYARAIRREKPDVVFSTDYTVLKRLRAMRGRLGVPFRTLLSNGGPVHPPFHEYDHVHQVAPAYLEEALQAGESAERQTLVPYGLNVPAGRPVVEPAARKAARQALGLPTDRKIVLSVGWISATHKRMDYTVREIAAMPAEGRPYLVMLGRMDETSRAVLSLAGELLGTEHFRALSVPYEQVQAYYGAGDIFVLSSLTEGFGRVYLEALVAGLPVVAHEGSVQRFVLGEEGTFGNLSQPGELAKAIAGLLPRALTADDATHRREAVRARFSWPALAAEYRRLFERAASTPI